MEQVEEFLSERKQAFGRLSPSTLLSKEKPSKHLNSVLVSTEADIFSTWEVQGQKDAADSLDEKLNERKENGSHNFSKSSTNSEMNVGEEVRRISFAWERRWTMLVTEIELRLQEIERTTARSQIEAEYHRMRQFQIWVNDQTEYLRDELRKHMGKLSSLEMEQRLLRRRTDTATCRGHGYSRRDLLINEFRDRSVDDNIHNYCCDEDDKNFNSIGMKKLYKNVEMKDSWWKRCYNPLSDTLVPVRYESDINDRDPNARKSISKDLKIDSSLYINSRGEFSSPRFEDLYPYLSEKSNDHDMNKRREKRMEKVGRTNINVENESLRRDVMHLQRRVENLVTETSRLKVSEMETFLKKNEDIGKNNLNRSKEPRSRSSSSSSVNASESYWRSVASKDRLRKLDLLSGGREADAALTATFVGHEKIDRKRRQEKVLKI
eukprot:g6401.t1